MTDAEGGAAEPPAFETGALPDLGKNDRLVLMAVDPYLVYAYWNLTAGRIEAAQALFGKDELDAHVLRFHDTTGIDFDGVNCGNSFDVRIRLDAGKWYVRLWSPERRYCADIGLRGRDGRLVALVRSNLIETPAAWPHVKVDEAAALVEQGAPDSYAATVPREAEPPAALEPAYGPPAATAQAEPRIPVRTAAEALNPVSADAPEALDPAPAPASSRADSRVVLARRLAEVAALREEPLPSGAPGNGDLTEMAEKSFVPGVSSVIVGARGRSQ
jgi:hypothetical protein